MAGRRRLLTPDEYVRGLCAKVPNLLIPHFLIHSWLYYVADQPIISDSTFDWIVSELDARWDTVDHPHKGLIDRGVLKSGFYLEYPTIVEHSAGALSRLFSA